GSDAPLETDAWIGSAVASRGDAFLLCSDGLYGQVSEEEIERICAEARAGEAVQHLVQRANEAGGIDNVSVILVNFLEGYPVTRVSGQKFSLRKIGPLPEVESTVADPESADEAAPGEIPDDAQAGLPTRISVGPIQALFFVCAAFLSGLFLGSEALVMTSAGTPAQLAVADVDAGRASLRPSKPTAVSPQQPSLAAEARRLSEHHPELRASLALYEVTHAQYVAQAEKLLTTAPSPEREKMVFELLAKFENARFELEKEVALASQLELSRDNRSTK
ncbi:MAG: hypothetical protein J0M12_05235, partial [Deltaproteobacteria bacterium]|nr:hypothetical protein [Deltaproteobacteria bacterium]